MWQGFACNSHLCALDIVEGNYTILSPWISKMFFDNGEWRKIFLQIREMDCRTNIAGTIATYLKFRSIFINWGWDTSVHPSEKCCFQDSCLGPVLWLLCLTKKIGEIMFYSLRFRGGFQLCFLDPSSSGSRAADSESFSWCFQLLTRVHL